LKEDIDVFINGKYWAQFEVTRTRLRVTIYYFIHPVSSVQAVNNQESVTLQDVHLYYFIEVNNMKRFCE